MSEEENVVIPEVTPVELSEWMQNRPDLLLLDVREPYEFPRARLNDERVAYAPMSELARKHLAAIPAAVQEKSKTVVVFCHHGFRSAQVAAWLMDLGWSSVFNLAGGIDAYARQVDPDIGFY
jgi:rhodanese-related sulfurtransferase